LSIITAEGNPGIRASRWFYRSGGWRLSGGNRLGWFQTQRWHAVAQEGKFISAE
jgi:hypothetical protein